LSLCECLAADVGAVVEGQVAARRQRIQQLPDDRPGLVIVGDVPEDAHQHQRDRSGEVQVLAVSKILLGSRRSAST
jgi:hypothetical protein